MYVNCISLLFPNVMQRGNALVQFNTALPEDEKNVPIALNSGEDLVEWFFISSQLGCNVLTKLSSFLCSEFFFMNKKNLLNFSLLQYNK